MSKHELVAAVLMELYDRKGVLQAADIVEEAKSSTHPLHDEFEWDDSTAGNLYRLDQAAELIRTVKISVVTSDEVFKVRAFHPRRYAGTGDNGYVHNNDIVGDPIVRANLLQAMQREWTSLKRRYSHHQEFWSMVKADLSEGAATGTEG